MYHLYPLTRAFCHDGNWTYVDAQYVLHNTNLDFIVFIDTENSPLLEQINEYLQYPAIVEEIGWNLQDTSFRKYHNFNPSLLDPPAIFSTLDELKSNYPELLL